MRPAALAQRREVEVISRLMRDEERREAKAALTVVAAVVVIGIPFLLGYLLGFLAPGW